jgi:hypothetical protein
VYLATAFELGFAEADDAELPLLEWRIAEGGKGDVERERFCGGVNAGLCAASLLAEEYSVVMLLYCTDCGS